MPIALTIIKGDLPYITSLPLCYLEAQRFAGAFVLVRQKTVNVINHSEPDKKGAKVKGTRLFFSGVTDLLPHATLLCAV